MRVTRAGSARGREVREVAPDRNHNIGRLQIGGIHFAGRRHRDPIPVFPEVIGDRRRDDRVGIVDVDDEGRLRLDDFKRILSSRTRLVAFSHVSNVLGFINPAKELCTLARQAGARIVIDGAQAAPHVKIDVQARPISDWFYSTYLIVKRI